MKNSLQIVLLAAISAQLALATEERNMDMETNIIGTLENYAASTDSDSKFVTYTTHLGMPAMHSDALECKSSSHIGSDKVFGHLYDTSMRITIGFKMVFHNT